MQRPITSNDVANNPESIADMLEYWIWLGELEHGYTLQAGDVAAFIKRYVYQCNDPSDVAEDLCLPVADWW